LLAILQDELGDLERIGDELESAASRLARADRS